MKQSKITIIRLLFLSFFLMILGFTTHAQGFRTSVNFHYGINKFNAYPSGLGYLSKETKNNYFLLGGQLQYFFYEGYFTELGFSLNYAQRQFQLTDFYPPGFGTEYNRLERIRKTFFYTAPISMGCKIKWFTLKIGLQILHTVNLDESESMVYSKIYNQAETTRKASRTEVSRFYLERIYQIAIALHKNIEVQTALIHHPNDPDHDGVYPKYRYTFGLAYFFD